MRISDWSSDVCSPDLKSEFGRSPELEAGSIAKTVAFLREEIKRLERAIDDHIDRHPDLKDDQELLTSIPSVGPQTGNDILSIMRSEERRVGKGSVRPCRSRWSQYQ